MLAIFNPWSIMGWQQKIKFIYTNWPAQTWVLQLHGLVLFPVPGRDAGPHVGKGVLEVPDWHGDAPPPLLPLLPPPEVLPQRRNARLPHQGRHVGPRETFTPENQEWNEFAQSNQEKLLLAAAYRGLKIRKKYWPCIDSNFFQAHVRFKNRPKKFFTFFKFLICYIFLSFLFSNSKYLVWCLFTVSNRQSNSTSFKKFNWKVIN